MMIADSHDLAEAERRRNPRSSRCGAFSADRVQGRTPQALRRLCSLLAAVAFIGCTGTRVPMWTPSELQATGHAYAVRGHVRLFRRRVSFGPYETVRASVGTQTSDHIGPTMFNGWKRTDTYRQESSFTLQAPTGRFEGRCRASKRKVTQRAPAGSVTWRGQGDVDIEHRERVRRVESHHSYECEVMQPGSTALRLDISAGSPPILQLPSGGITLVEVHRGAGQGEASHDVNVHGYLFYERSEAIAALDLSLGFESVRLREDLSQTQRDALAAACTALLIRRDMTL